MLYGLYASVFVGLWLRLVGAHVERGAEVSTAVGITPDLLSIGEDSFVADGVLLGDEAQRAGWMHLKCTRIGARSFIGNGAYVADGTQLPEDVLIGVQSATPENALLKPGQTWLGSPALILPARETLCAPEFAIAASFRALPGFETQWPDASFSPGNGLITPAPRDASRRSAFDFRAEV